MAKGSSKTTELKNTLPRRMYKERGQLQKREHLGILEKKKDYKRRSTDFKNKDKIISKYSLHYLTRHSYRETWTSSCTEEPR